MVSDTATGVPLESELKEKIHRALQSVPVVGLPHGGMGYGIRPTTDEHLVAIIEHLGHRLGETLRAKEQQRVELSNLKDDIQAVRRIFGTAMDGVIF